MRLLLFENTELCLCEAVFFIKYIDLCFSINLAYLQSDVLGGGFGNVDLGSYCLRIPNCTSVKPSLLNV